METAFGKFGGLFGWLLAIPSGNNCREMGWITLLFAALCLLLVRIPVVRLFAGLSIFALPVVFLCSSDDSLFEETHQRNAVQQLGTQASVRGGVDHGNMPERFSQLFSEYLHSEDQKAFVETQARDFKERYKRGEADPKEVEFVRTILRCDGRSSTDPAAVEREYQRRLNGKTPSDR